MGGTKDAYVQLVDSSWTALMLGAALAFLGINLIFAGLYLLQTGCIAGVSEPTVLEAFAFSVQTFSTIGYGGLSPGTPFGHVLVTV